MTILSKLTIILYSKFRIWKYKLLSTNKNIINFKGVILNQPLLAAGNGTLQFGNNIRIGYNNSPSFYSSYCYLEAREQSSRIIIHNNSFINNNFYAIADRTTIEIKENTIIGINCSIVDSPFHSINPDDRMSSNYTCADVVINENVFIGSNVTILKGVTIGKNSVIANGSLVNRNIPPSVIAGGITAIVIKSI